MMNILSVLCFKKNCVCALWAIISFVAAFIAGLAKYHQNIYWISDQDNIFANRDRAEDDVLRLLGVLIDLYIDFDLGALGVGTTQIDEADRFVEDLSSIPDLAAGAFSELVNKLNVMVGGRIAGNLAYPIPNGVSEKVDVIISWFMEDNHRLRRLLLLIEESQNGLYGLKRIFIE